MILSLSPPGVLAKLRTGTLRWKLSNGETSTTLMRIRQTIIQRISGYCASGVMRADSNTNGRGLAARIGRRTANPSCYSAFDSVGAMFKFARIKRCYYGAIIANPKQTG